jgi:hypothetical protein
MEGLAHFVSHAPIDAYAVFIGLNIYIFGDLCPIFYLGHFSAQDPCSLGRSAFFDLHLIFDSYICLN